MQRKLYIVFYLALAAVRAHAAEAVVAPWRAIGIDARQVGLARSALDSSVRSFVQSQNGGDAPSLTSRRQGLSLNAQRYAGRHLLMKVETEQAPLYAPIWCSWNGDALLFLIAGNQRSELLQQSAHMVVSQASWRAALSNRALPQLLTDALHELQKKLAAKTTAATTDTALALRLSLAREVSGPLSIAGPCLNLLLAERLSETYAVLNPVGAENAAFVREHPASAKPTDDKAAPVEVLALPRRATRILSLDWQRQADASWLLRAHASEGILGRAVNDFSYDGVVNIAVDAQGSPQMEAPALVLEFLQGEARALALGDAPVISKIHGAWVYLDRGRAWGLEMNDRLVGAAGAPIKAHIVGYFGPELGLKSPRGFVIREGAIAFVRVGQHDVKLGQAMGFDQQAYPK